jgi:predicted ATPase/DNA-binding CsgD family transcriptional regulator
VTRADPNAHTAGVHGFGAPLTSFVGRAAEVAELGAMLEKHRLVTVTGPGGVGKTRAAEQVARRTAVRFADGVWLVELASGSDPALVPAAACSALGVHQVPGAAVTDALVTAVSRQQLLLVLDNCEHVLAAVAELCGRLLSAADDLRILATSREPLGVPGEARYRLPPLGLPVPGGRAGPAESDAVALFAERARLVDAHFTVSGESAPVVARLVERLDGMPLAIELAAARVEALGAAGVLDRLDDRLRLLGGGNRATADRHRSLAAAADWSYRLLTEPEQRVFRFLGAFPGPFTLEAAEAVAGADAGPAVWRLVDCSLLTPPSPGPDGRARYLMLETLRAYAGERLTETGEQPEAAARLAAYALVVAEQAGAGLETNTGELAAATWLDAEDATVHQGLAWALEHDPDLALVLALALARWWILRGRYAAGYTWLARAAEHATPGGTAWCEAQMRLGDMSGISGPEVDLGYFTSALDALAGGPPSPLLVQVLAKRAGSLANLGRLPEAADDARRALALAKQIGDPDGQARALYWLGATAHYAGEPEEALGWLRQALRIDPARLPASQVRRCLGGLTIALIATDQLEEAEQNCARSLALSRQAENVYDQCVDLILMAELDLLADRIPGAKACLREQLELAGLVSDLVCLLDCLDLCGLVCVRMQRWADALTTWAALAALRQDAGVLDPPHDARRREEPLRQAREALGPERTRAAEQRGAAMAAGAAAEYAALLVTEDPSEPQVPSETSPALSVRERELVTLVAQGRTNAQIAGQLFISVRTVGSHLDRIRDKTGCRRRADLTRLALQVGLV